MIKGNRTLVLAVIFMVAAAGSVFAQKVMATNQWTAELARLAGASDVTVIAPVGMKHPPEYEITMKQLRQVSRADYIVFAGYEAMIPKIKESMGKRSSVELIQVKTVNNYPTIRESVMKIAGILGTEDLAEENLVEIELFLDLWKRELYGIQGLDRILVHFHQQGLARSLGIEPASLFGPAPPSLKQISDILELQPLVIIDNYHNRLAAPFLEQENPPKTAVWINFPGAGGTETLMDVLIYNKKQLMEILTDF